MKLRLGLLAVLVSGSVAATEPARAPEPSSELGKAFCACLQAPPAEFSGQRDGGRGISFLVPEGFVDHRPEPYDPKRLRWDGPGGAGIGYDLVGAWKVNDSDHNPTLPPDERCVLEVRGERVLVTYDREGAAYRAGFDVESRSHAAWPLAFSVRSPDLAGLCRIGANALWSIEFVDHWQGLRVLEIAPDRSWFEYENEIGERKTARVGDTVSRDHGVVKQINADDVLVEELLPDAEGVWQEHPRRLTLAEPARRE